jgi:hypothetical protein
VSYYIYIVVVLFILLRLIRRTIANYRGTGFSMGRTYLSAFLYVAIGVVFSGVSFAGGVSPLLAIPEIGLAVAAAFGSYSYANNHVKLWKTSEGSVRIQGGVEVYLIYLVGLITRLFIYIAVGPSIFAFSSGTTLSGTALYGSMAADLVLIFGVGLLLGKYLRSVKMYHRIQRGEETASEAPRSSD